MMTCECIRERDVIEAISAQRWPDKVDPSLRLHASSCSVCGDMIEVAIALRADYEREWQDARLPPSGVVWWRARLRAHDDAARAAAWPLAFIQGVAASVAVWLAVSLLRTIAAADLAPWRPWFREVAASSVLTMPDLAGVSQLTWIVPVSVVCLLAAWLLAPIAIYFAVVDE